MTKPYYTEMYKGVKIEVIKHEMKDQYRYDNFIITLPDGSIEGFTSLNEHLFTLNKCKNLIDSMVVVDQVKTLYKHFNERSRIDPNLFETSLFFDKAHYTNKI